MNWYDDLCEYYFVTPSVAIELGVRKTGRKPNLPGSITCKPVSGKNFEELWSQKLRDTVQQKMDFYKEIGSWMVFRQCNYRHDFNYGNLFYPYIKENSNILEYGCGIAPLTNYIIDNKKINVDKMKFCIVDVSGEHLEFAKWRLRKKCPKINLEVHEITEKYIIPNFSEKFDVCCVMDVMEHLPNPYNVINNIYNSCLCGATIVLTWVDKSEGKHGGPDLEEAEKERNITMGFIKNNSILIKGGSIKIYQKNENNF